MYTLAITVVPSIIILLFFYLSDKFKEPKSTITTVFFLGILICLPAGILNGFMSDNFGDPKNQNDLTHSFLGPAWTEEILKFLVLYTIVLRRKEFNEPMDGLVYGVVVSLGFATYENYTYVYEWAAVIAQEENVNLSELSNYIAFARSYSAVPMHGLNGAVMGYYFGMYAFSGNKNFLGLSLGLPYLFHGFYNYILFPNSMIIIVILLIFSLYLHKDLRKKQELKKTEKEQIKIKIK